MPFFEIYVSDEDRDRIFAIKQIQGKTSLTGSEFAAELLHSKLINLFPEDPEYDDGGYITNLKSYRGT